MLHSRALLGGYYPPAWHLLYDMNVDKKWAFWDQLYLPRLCEWHLIYRWCNRVWMYTHWVDGQKKPKSFQRIFRERPLKGWKLSHRNCKGLISQNETFQRRWFNSENNLKIIPFLGKFIWKAWIFAPLKTVLSYIPRNRRKGARKRRSDNADLIGNIIALDPDFGS